jgi:hypothetical protein
MEFWWNDTEGGKLNDSEKIPVSFCQFVHHKSQMDWPGIELGPVR